MWDLGPWSGASAAGIIGRSTTAKETSGDLERHVAGGDEPRRTDLTMRFADRRAAGELLAEEVAALGLTDAVVLGLPRGGVPVAFDVARRLGAPLDVLVVRKLGVPFQPELGMGAIGEGGVRVLNPDVMRVARVSDDELARVERSERAELERRAAAYRAGRPPMPLAGRTAIVVDDGIATGGTARAALQVARAHGAARVVLAVPVAPPETIASLVAAADDIVCLEQPNDLYAVGAWYRDFTPVPDAEVVRLLAESAAWAAPVDDPPVDEEVQITGAGARLPGHLVVPEGASGVVLFAHGSGSSRHSPRNRVVAAMLNAAGLGTLLFDLLSPDESLDRGNVFDVPLLAARLEAATTWLHDRDADLPIGYFGASTGAAAALWAAGDPGAVVAAVVSRGGRPDLAGHRLGAVRAPTLLIVGGADDLVLGLNREAESLLRCERRLEVVPGATHLFEEPGALDAVARLAANWFVTHFRDARTRA
jgi:putative phosphoribosyl transferase